MAAIQRRLAVEEDPAVVIVAEDDMIVENELEEVSVVETVEEDEHQNERASPVGSMGISRQ